jgi:hypothetical protein
MTWVAVSSALLAVVAAILLLDMKLRGFMNAQSARVRS